MSIEVDIFPTTLSFPVWGEVKYHLKTLLADQTDLIQGLSLRIIGSDALIGDEDKLLSEGVFYLELSVPNALGIVVSKGDDIDKKEYLDC